MSKWTFDDWWNYFASTSEALSGPGADSCDPEVAYQDALEWCKEQTRADYAARGKPVPEGIFDNMVALAAYVDEDCTVIGALCGNMSHGDEEEGNFDGGHGSADDYWHWRDDNECSTKKDVSEEDLGESKVYDYEPPWREPRKLTTIEVAEIWVKEGEKAQESHDTLMEAWREVLRLDLDDETPVYGEEGDGGEEGEEGPSIGDVLPPPYNPDP